MSSPLDELLLWHDKQPDATILRFIDEETSTEHCLNLDQILLRARALACAITQHGKQDDIIGLHLELEPNLYIAFYACWLAGRTPTVLNLTWSPEIRQKVLNRLDIKTILHTRLHPDLELEETNLTIINIDQAIASNIANAPSFEVRQEPFYALINQSSGTTGVPKVSFHT